MIQMNRQWMYNADRRSKEYVDGMHSFLEVAKANKKPKGFMCCPCSQCRNEKYHADWRTLHLHLIKNRFMPNYVVWTQHSVRIDGPRGGGELGLFQFLKQSKATLTYAMLVGHQFTNRITKQLTQAKRAKTR